MSNWKIRFYDDEEGGREQYFDTLDKSKDIKARFDIQPIEPDDFREGLGSLRERQIALRKGENWKDKPSLFDDISVMIIDYDLVKASDIGSFLTGANVSYYVRCFSKCKFILGLNQFGTNTFDLTLKGHPKSYADLDIGSEQLGNPRLWGGETDGFGPWYWPDIPGYLSKLGNRIKDLEGNLDENIRDFFEIPKEIFGILPRSVSEFIGSDPQITTFRKFLTNSGNGLARKDNDSDKLDEEFQTLLIASRISKWLEQLVLPGQNILIDAPHLVQRYPSLLKGDPATAEAWNKTTALDEPDKIGIDHATIEEYRFKKDHWLSRPAWFLNGIINCQNIAEVADPWIREPSKYAFCEDSSAFHEKEKCHEFLAELESPYIRRYVRYFEEPGIDIEYVPRVRLSL